jgi:hypothetical protein
LQIKQQWDWTKLFMNITPYTVISIETLLFGSDNLTDENNLIVFRNVQKYNPFYTNHTSISIT